MKRDIENLKNSQFDLIVIGGGITGACLAHDSALRGIKTALIEKHDFGGFTSSASSKLLHGGIRYFPSGQFHKTRESARERTIFQLLAPHLTHYIPFLVPTFSGSLMKGAFVLRSGMLLYGALCRGLEGMIADPGKRIPRNTYLSKRQVMKAFPELAGVPRLAGGQILYESHMLSSERMTLAFIATAVANGACAANYIEAIRLIADNGRVAGVEVKDQFSKQAFTIRGSVVANAAGPALPTINATLPELRLTKPTTGFSKGVHLVTRQINPRFALAMATAHKTEGLVTRGGRHFFIIPWRNRSLIGTTNVPFNGDLDSVAVEKKDIVEFINDIDATLPELQLKEADVAYAFAGLYPLTAKKIRKDTYQGTGEYQIVDHEKTNSVGGIISVLGAKYTTARKVAQLATDVVQQKLSLATTACVTDRQPLRCGQITDLKAFTLARQKAYGKLLSTRQITRLVNYYGRDIDALLTLAGESPQMLAPIAAGHDMLMVEIVHAIKAEMALTLADVVFRRTGLGTTGHPGSEALKNCATQLAAERGWDDDRIQAEIQAVEKMYRYE